MSSTLPTVSDQEIESLLDTVCVQRAFEFFESRADAITAEQIQIHSVAAPPLGEFQRAEYLRHKFFALGLVEAQIDSEGNCIALRPGASNAPLLIISAHLDTVFPVDTDLTVRRVGAKLFAPGIADDACGLAAL